MLNQDAPALNPFIYGYEKSIFRLHISLTELILLMASSTRETFRWKKEAVEALLDTLIDLDDERLRGAIITPTQIWETAAARTTKAQGSTINARAAKSKRDIMKREYKIWTQILAQPGFARDENGDLLASDTLWDAYIQV